jgi:hypothetical protein
MNKPDISESLQTGFWVKILKFFDVDNPEWEEFESGLRDGKNSDPGWKKFGSGMEKLWIWDGKNSDLGWKKIRIRDKHPGSASLHFYVDPLHKLQVSGDLNGSSTAMGRTGAR